MPIVIRRTVFGLFFFALATFVLAPFASVQAQTTTDIQAQEEPAIDLENRLYIALERGRVIVDLRPDLAPNHVERIKTLARQGFYDGIVFHRVIDGFMAQTGDPTGTGRGGSDLPDLAAEFSDANFARGVLGMARAQNPNSANSQFFIMYADGPWLNGQYTVFGEVVEGMEFVDGLKKGSQAQNGLVKDPDSMISVRVAADVE